MKKTAFFKFSGPVRPFLEFAVKNGIKIHGSSTVEVPEAAVQRMHAEFPLCSFQPIRRSLVPPIEVDLQWDDAFLERAMHAVPNTTEFIEAFEAAFVPSAQLPDVPPEHLPLVQDLYFHYRGTMQLHSGIRLKLVPVEQPFAVVTAFVAGYATYSALCLTLNLENRYKPFLHIL